MSRVHRTRRLACAALLLLATSGCAQDRATQQQALADSIVKEVSTSRDSAPHVGTPAREVDPALIRAVAQASDDWACRHAIVRMLDSLGDQHIDMGIPQSVEIGFPRGLVLCPLDGKVWGALEDAQNWGFMAANAVLAAQYDGSRDEWARIDAIDGYEPRTLGGVRGLLQGAPGTTVRVRVTTLDGQVGSCDLRREPTATGKSNWHDPRAGGLIRFFATTASLPIAWKGADAPPANLERWPPTARRLGPGGSVGYLRIPSLGERDEDDKKPRGHEAERAALRAAIDQVRDCETIILDLAENRGGCACMPRELLQAFLHPLVEEIPYRIEIDPRRIPSGVCVAWRVPLDDISTNRYGGRLIVLVDDMTCSAAEVAVESLRGAPNVTIIGAPTSGAGFGVVNLEVSRPPMTLCLGARPIEWIPPHSSPEAAPIQPDVLVPIDPAALALYGPIGAIARRRFEMLATAWRAAGLDAPTLPPVPQTHPRPMAFPGSHPWWTLIAPEVPASPPASTPDSPSP
ncbi:MAG: S41 family peptidase [Phycisphaerales bacterium]